MDTSAQELQSDLQKSAAKVFCIGFNKTGTTSIRVALEGLGYKVGNQPEAERFISDWARRDFARIIDYCGTADAFQDIPFSLPTTYRILDATFPGSKFILTVRKTSEDWYRSLTTFHAKLFGGGRVPTEEDLAQACYRFKGWVHLVMKSVYDFPAGDPYNRERLIRTYESHNAAVHEYFRQRPADLLTIDLAADDSYQRFCRFLGKSPNGSHFPWENRSSEHAAGHTAG